MSSDNKGISFNIKNIIKNIDVFGKEYSFQESNSSLYSTYTGGVFTITLYISVVVLGIIFGKELVNRRIPITISSNEIVTSKESIIRIDEFPIFITILDRYGKVVEDIDRVVNLKASHFLIDDKSNITSKVFSLENCEKTEFSKNLPFVYSEYLKRSINSYTFKNKTTSSFCLNTKSNLVFYNKYSAVDSSFVNIDISICDPLKQECVSNYKEISNNLFVFVRFLNTYIDHKNFSDPITYFDDIVTTQVGGLLSKRNYLRFSQNIINDDNGWLLEAFSNKTYISLSNIKHDITMSVNNIIHQITFESPNLVVKTSRSYMKIQELIAKIGGLYSGFSIIISIIIKNYINFSYILSIFEKISMSYIAIRDNKENKSNILDRNKNKNDNDWNKSSNILQFRNSNSNNNSCNSQIHKNSKFNLNSHVPNINHIEKIDHLDNRINNQEINCISKINEKNDFIKGVEIRNIPKEQKMNSNDNQNNLHLTDYINLSNYIKSDYFIFYMKSSISMIFCCLFKKENMKFNK